MTSTEKLPFQHLIGDSRLTTPFIRPITPFDPPMQCVAGNEDESLCAESASHVGNVLGIPIDFAACAEHVDLLRECLDLVGNVKPTITQEPD